MSSKQSAEGKIVFSTTLPFICVRVFELSNRIEYFVRCIGAFAEKYSLSNNQGSYK